MTMKSRLRRIGLRASVRLLTGVVAVALSSVAAQASVAGHDWLTFRGDGPQVAFQPLDADRRSELESQEAGFVDLLVRIDVSRERSTYVERVRVVRLFLNTDGIEVGGDMEIFVSPSYERLDIQSAYSIPSDGTPRRIEPATVQVTDVTTPGIFTDAQTVTVPCAAVGVGAICALDYTLRFREKDFPLPWATSTRLAASHPVERIEIEAVGLTEGHVWRTNDEALACAEQGGRLTCSKTRTEALPPDINLELAGDYVPEFTIGRDLTWAEIADRVGRIVERETAKGLPAGTAKQILDRAGVGDDPNAIWDELFRFSADEVRYLGFEQGRNAVVPHPPATTFDRRYGDCKDKVTLLIALARQAGLRAFPVLVATERYSIENAAVPASGYFDHMVVCFEPKQGPPRCGDPTLSNTLPDDTALAIGARLALALREGTTAPHLMESPDFASKIEIESRTTIDCDGGITTRTTRALAGAAKIRFRAGYANMDPSVRRRFLAEEHQQVSRSLLEPKMRVEAFHDRSRPIEIEATIPEQDAQELAKEHLQLDYDHWLVHHANEYRAVNINYPYRIDGIDLVSRHVFETCGESFVRYHGPALEMATRFGRLDREYLRSKDGIEVESRLHIPARVISVEEFEQINHFLDNALAQTTIWFELVERN